MGRAAASAHCAAATVKQLQAHITLARDHVQVAVRFVDFPRAGQHATIFVRIRVTQHDLLPALPRIEELAVLG